MLWRGDKCTLTIHLTGEINEITEKHKSSVNSYYISTVGDELFNANGSGYAGFDVLVMHLKDNTAHLFHLGEQYNHNAPRYLGYVDTTFTSIINISIDKLSRIQIEKMTTISIKGIHKSWN